MNRVVTFQFLIHELIRDYSADYVYSALKLINDRQFFRLKSPKLKMMDHPILKLLEVVVQELEAFLFSESDDRDVLSVARECMEAVLQDSHQC